MFYQLRVFVIDTHSTWWLVVDFRICDDFRSNINSVQFQPDFNLICNCFVFLAFQTQISDSFPKQILAFHIDKLV